MGLVAKAISAFKNADAQLARLNDRLAAARAELDRATSSLGSAMLAADEGKPNKDAEKRLAAAHSDRAEAQRQVDEFEAAIAEVERRRHEKDDGERTAAETERQAKANKSMAAMVEAAKAAEKDLESFVANVRKVHAEALILKPIAGPHSGIGDQVAKMYLHLEDTIGAELSFTGYFKGKLLGGTERHPWSHHMPTRDNIKIERR